MSKDDMPTIGAAIGKIVGDLTTTIAEGPERSADARTLLKAGLTPALEAAAHTLEAHPFSMTTLAAVMLVEQLFAIDRAAALLWLDALRAELTATSAAQADAAAGLRFEAFTKLAEAAAKLERTARHGPLDLRLFL